MMKLVVVLALFATVVLARPQAPVEVVEYTNENDGTGNYNYRYYRTWMKLSSRNETSNQKGLTKNILNFSDTLFPMVLSATKLELWKKFKAMMVQLKLSLWQEATNSSMTKELSTKSHTPLTRLVSTQKLKTKFSKNVREKKYFVNSD